MVISGLITCCLFTGTSLFRYCLPKIRYGLSHDSVLIKIVICTKYKLYCSIQHAFHPSCLAIRPIKSKHDIYQQRSVCIRRCWYFVWFCYQPWFNNLSTCHFVLRDHLQNTHYHLFLVVVRCLIRCSSDFYLLSILEPITTVFLSFCNRIIICKFYWLNVAQRTIVGYCTVRSYKLRLSYRVQWLVTPNLTALRSSVAKSVKSTVWYLFITWDDRTDWLFWLTVLRLLNWL